MCYIFFCSVSGFANWLPTIIMHSIHKYMLVFHFAFVSLSCLEVFLFTRDVLVFFLTKENVCRYLQVLQASPEFHPCFHSLHKQFSSLLSLIWGLCNSSFLLTLKVVLVWRSTVHSGVWFGPFFAILSPGLKKEIPFPINLSRCLHWIFFCDDLGLVLSPVSVKSQSWVNLD